MQGKEIMRSIISQIISFPPSNLYDLIRCLNFKVLWTPIKSLETAALRLNAWKTELTTGMCAKFSVTSRLAFYQSLLRSFSAIREVSWVMEFCIKTRLNMLCLVVLIVVSKLSPKFSPDDSWYWTGDQSSLNRGLGYYPRSRVWRGPSWCQSLY